MDMEIMETTDNFEELGTQPNCLSQVSNENHQLVTANSSSASFSFQLSCSDDLLLRLTPPNIQDQMEIGISSLEQTSLHLSKQK